MLERRLHGVASGLAAAGSDDAAAASTERVFGTSRQVVPNHLHDNGSVHGRDRWRHGLGNP